MDGIAVNSIRSPDARIFDELKTRLSASLPIGKPEVKKGGYINYCSDAKMETTSKVWTKPFPPPTEADDAPDDGDVEPSLEEVASPSPIIDHGTVFDPNNPWHTTDDNSNKISWNFVTEPSLVVELQSENTEPEEGGN